MKNCIIRNFLILCGIALAISKPAVAAAIDPAHGLTGPGSGDAAIGPLVAIGLGGPWQEFSLGVAGAPARGCFPADPAGTECIPGVNSTFVGAPPWTFTAPSVGA